ncbi:MAG: hypothetical protein NTY53_25680 [Kiritimatiellaeota bacterium]|nr:hypothetical protein [Kiritimatiellota bacterium]
MNKMFFQLVVLLGAALAPGGTEPAFPVSDAPYLAVYRWGAANKVGGAQANEAYARWLNRPAPRLGVERRLVCVARA